MSRVTDETPSSSISITCAWRGAEDQTAGRTCQICNRLTVRLPDWATHEGKRFKWLTRRHLIMAAVSLVIRGFVAWMNYPFLPDPAVILFKRPITSLSSASLPGQWSMVGWDSQLSRYLPRVTGYPVGRALWTKDLGEPTRSAPTVADGVIYVGAHFKVLALDAETGNTVWELETNGPLHYSAAVAGTNLFVGMLDHRLLALDRKTGNIIWEFRSQGPITTSPLVANGIAYFGSSDEFIYALDASNGNVIWKEEIQDKVRSSVAVYGGIRRYTMESSSPATPKETSTYLPREWAKPATGSAPPPWQRRLPCRPTGWFTFPAGEKCMPLTPMPGRYRGHSGLSRYGPSFGYGGCH